MKPKGDFHSLKCHGTIVLRHSHAILQVQDAMPPVPRDKDDVSRALQAFVGPDLKSRHYAGSAFPQPGLGVPTSG